MLYQIRVVFSFTNYQKRHYEKGIKLIIYQLIDKFLYVFDNGLNEKAYK